MQRYPNFRQQGAVLIVSLLILLVLTLLAVSGMQSTGLQQKMVSARQDSVTALEGAGFALKAAEKTIDGWSTLPDASSTNGVYTQGGGPSGNALFDNTLWSDSSKSIAAANPTDSNGKPILANSPRYFIEYMGKAQIQFGNETANPNMHTYQHESGAATVEAFRIVAWSSGASGQSQRIVEEYYRRSF